MASRQAPALWNEDESPYTEPGYQSLVPDPTDSSVLMPGAMQRNVSSPAAQLEQYLRTNMGIGPQAAREQYAAQRLPVAQQPPSMEQQLMAQQQAQSQAMRDYFAQREAVMNDPGVMRRAQRARMWSGIAAAGDALAGRSSADPQKAYDSYMDRVLKERSNAAATRYQLEAMRSQELMSALKMKQSLRQEVFKSGNGLYSIEYDENGKPRAVPLLDKEEQQQLFGGTSFDAQLFNQYLSSLPPDQRAAAISKLAESKLFDAQAAAGAGGTSATGAATGKPVTTTDTERSAAGFYQRLQGAEGSFSEFQAKYPNFDPSGFVGQGLAKIGSATNSDALVPEEMQMWQAIKDDWSEAYLRATSGATITDADIKNTGDTFFPKSGSSPEKQAQLAKQRASAMQQVLLKAGRAAPASIAAPPAAGGGGYTDEQLARIAAKRGISVEQVRAVIAASRGANQ